MKETFIFLHVDVDSIFPNDKPNTLIVNYELWQRI